MKRSLANVAVAALTVAALAACGNDGESSANAATPSGSNSLEPITVNWAVAPATTAQLPFYVAEEIGTFDEQALDVQFVNVGSGAAMAPAFASRQADLMTSSLAVLIRLVQEGQGAQAVTAHSVGYNYTIYVRDGVDVPTDGTFEEQMEALEGLTIGAQGGAEGVVVPFLKAVMELGGADPSTLNMPNVTYGGPQVAALQGGEVDAVIADDATVATADQLDLGGTYFSLLKDAPDEATGLLISSILANADFLSQNEGFAERLVAAMQKTYEWMQDPDNAEELHRIAVEVMGLPDEPGLDKRLVTSAGLYDGASLSKDQLERSLDFVYESGQVAPEPRLTVDEFFAPEVIG